MTAKEILQTLTDVFSGADGGGHFLRFRFMLEQIEKEAADGSESGKQLMTIAERFVRMVNAANLVLSWGPMSL